MADDASRIQRWLGDAAGQILCAEQTATGGTAFLAPSCFVSSAHEITSYGWRLLAILPWLGLGFFVGMRFAQTCRRKRYANFVASMQSGTSSPSKSQANFPNKAIANGGVGRRAPICDESLAAPPPKCAAREGVCECGVLLPLDMSPKDLEAHRKSLRHKKNLFKLGGSSEVIVCEEIGEYRKAALQLVTQDDVVLEVGCHVGATMKVLATVAGTLVGLDQQPQLIAEARKNLPEIRFENFDGFDSHRLMALAREQPGKRFTKVFVDISGSRDICTVVKMVDLYTNILKPELIVVKSQTLKRLLLRSQLWVEHPESKSQAASPGA
eukprot:TRINITY_DN110733_c0_g1_i1.p1 TRINITY_DN110733_c0_g1~~TRINITY_DN110733_c0_g1_i1.p1  ORF type:complete len:344 (-),score=63.26 TRINITY_DN110733_c0_g1_i1:104-1078(-)